MSDTIQMPSTQASKKNAPAAVQSVPVGIPTEVFRQHQISITGVCVQTSQMPSQENDHTAVVEAELQTNKGAYRGIGAASPATCHGSTDTNTIFKKATAEAFANASATAVFATQTQEAIGTTLSPNKPIYSSSPNGQTKYRHSKAKPASDSQMNLIVSICRRKGISEQEAREAAGLSPEKPMSSSDANDVIRQLKGVLE